jgi:hypothetical protein
MFTIHPRRLVPAREWIKPKSLAPEKQHHFWSLEQEGSELHPSLVLERFANKQVGLLTWNKQKKESKITYFECDETSDYTKSEICDCLNQPNETPN